MSTNGTALDTVQNTALAAYGERAEVRELAARMMKFHPAYNDVGEARMIAAAQLAILSEANPLPTAGEIHIWKDWRGQLVVMLGIAFWRRKAREVDALVWFVDTGDHNQERRSYEPRLMLDEERTAYGVQPGDVAALCKAYRMSEYMKLLEAGIPWAVAQLMITRSGIGVVKRTEMFAKKDTRYRKAGDPIDPPHGRTWAWVACKRAEQDVYRALSLINENFYQQPSHCVDAPPPPIHATAAPTISPKSNGNGYKNLSPADVNDALFA